MKNLTGKLISEYFIENKYKWFVNYCHDVGLRYLDEIKNISLVELQNIKGVGQTKINTLMNELKINFDIELLASPLSQDISIVDNITIQQVFYEEKWELLQQYCVQNNLYTIKQLHLHGIYRLDTIGYFFGSQDMSEIYKRMGRGQENSYSIIHGTNLVNNWFNQIYPCFEDFPIDSLQYYIKNQRFMEYLKDNNVVTLKDLKESNAILQYKNLSSRIEQRLGIIEKWFESVPFETFQSILNSLNDETNYIILALRAEDLSLQEIGKFANMTRQRVQQIIAKWENMLSDIVRWCIKELLTTRKTFSYEDIQDNIDKPEYARIFYLICRSLKYVSYSRVGYFFVESNTVEGDVDNYLLSRLVDIVGEGLTLEQFYEQADELFRRFPHLNEETCLMLLKTKGYYLYGKYIAQSKSYGYLCSLLVKEYFPKGIKLYDSNDLDRFRQVAHEKYGDIEIAEDNRAFSARIQPYLVEYDRGAVVHASQVQIKLEVLEQIKRYIEKYPMEKLYFSEIFANFKEELSKNSNINNSYFLHGVIKLYFPTDYIYTRSYLKKTTNLQETETLESRMIQVLKSYPLGISVEQIRTKFPGISDAMLLAIGNESKYIYSVGSDYFNLIEHIQITVAEEKNIEKCLDDFLATNYNYCSEYVIADKIVHEFPEFVDRNKLDTSAKIFYVLKVMLGEKYQFRRPHIFVQKEYKISSRQLVIDELRRQEGTIIDIKVIKEFFKKYKLSVASLPQVIKEVTSDCFRIDRDLYVPKDTLSVTDYQIHQVEKIVQQHMQESFLPILSIKDWEVFPDVGLIWNPYLLAELIEKNSSRFKIINHKFSYGYFSSIIVVKEERVNSFVDLVYNILINRNIIEISEDKLLQLLKSLNLIIKNIPKEVYGTDKLKFNGKKFYIRQ